MNLIAGAQMEVTNTESQVGEAKMAKSVSMSTVRLDVARVTTAPEFHIKDNNAIVGDLRVSQGGVFWRPKSYQQYYQLSWEQVDELFRKHGVAKTVGEYKISAPTEAVIDDVGESAGSTASGTLS